MYATVVSNNTNLKKEFLILKKKLIFKKFILLNKDKEQKWESFFLNLRNNFLNVCYSCYFKYSWVKKKILST